MFKRTNEAAARKRKILAEFNGDFGAKNGGTKKKSIKLRIIIPRQSGLRKIILLS